MTIHIPEMEEIYSPKTKEYFQEVISSYSIGNYRSATVMLYSVAISDILYKLQELKDMYNDKKAIEILDKVNKIREDKTSKSKSTWEKELIDQVFNETELLNLQAYGNLNHLFDDRNLSAHPALNENFDLISPTQETTIAHIKNVLNDILVKPPIFIKNIVSMLTDELKEKSSIFWENGNEFKVYINNKYFRKMSKTMKIKVFKTLWKFCFIKTEDENCKNNRPINRRALAVLIDPILSDVFAEVKAHNEEYLVSLDEGCEFQFSALCSAYPELYKNVNQITRTQINKYINKNDNTKLGAWFLYESLEEHLKSLYNINIQKCPPENIQYVYEYYQLHGKEKSLLELFISKLASSYSFDCADNLFTMLITPFFAKFSDQQIVEIIQAVNNNSQLYNRGKSYYDNTELIKATISRLGKDFNFDMYPNFKFDVTILGKDKTEEENAD